MLGIWQKNNRAERPGATSQETGQHNENQFDRISYKHTTKNPK